MPTGLLTAAVVVGVGLSATSAVMGMNAASASNDAQQGMIAEQQKQEAIRMQTMELDAKRKQTENLRQVQRARALAVAAGSNQGAILGSGLQGGLGQITGQGNWNAQGISQNLGFGEQMFASNSILSQYKMDYANAQGDAATAQGLGSLGGTFVSAAGTIGNIGRNSFGGTASAPLYGGGAYNPSRPGSLY